MRTHFALILVISLAACAVPTAPDTLVAESFHPPAARSLVLLLHVPAAESAYRVGDSTTKKLVTEALTKAGYRVGHIQPADYALLLNSEMTDLLRRSPGASSRELAEAEFRALTTLARVACKEAESPLLIRTRLLTRPTTLWQSVATWDGQKRQVQFIDSDKVLANIHGTGPGMSIEAVATDPSGKLVVKSYGGASLPYISGRSGQSLARENLFSRDTELAEGVAIALQALLPR